MKLINSNRFFLPGQSRFLHLATVHDGVREFICFADTLEVNKVYIEEVTGGHLSFIEDDALAEALANFLRELTILDMGRALLDDSTWLRNNRET